MVVATCDESYESYGADKVRDQEIVGRQSIVSALRRLNCVKRPIEQTDMQPPVFRSLIPCVVYNHYSVTVPPDYMAHIIAHLMGQRPHLVQHLYAILGTFYSVYIYRMSSFLYS